MFQIEVGSEVSPDWREGVLPTYVIPDVVQGTRLFHWRVEIAVETRMSNYVLEPWEQAHHEQMGQHVQIDKPSDIMEIVLETQEGNQNAYQEWNNREIFQAQSSPATNIVEELNQEEVLQHHHGIKCLTKCHTVNKYALYYKPRPKGEDRHHAHQGEGENDKHFAGR